jgi:predicted alternative tryptophan synthase beta-subunit
MVYVEKEIELWQHMNDLLGAIASDDKKRIAEVIINMDFTEEEFIQFPTELVNTYRRVSQRATEILDKEE